MDRDLRKRKPFIPDFLQKQLTISLTLGFLMIHGKWIYCTIPFPVWVPKHVSQNHHNSNSPLSFPAFVRKLRYNWPQTEQIRKLKHSYPERQYKIQLFWWESRNASCCWCCISFPASKMQLIAIKSSTSSQVISVMRCSLSLRQTVGLQNREALVPLIFSCF